MNFLTKHKYDNFIPYLNLFRYMFEFSKECKINRQKMSNDLKKLKRV